MVNLKKYFFKDSKQTLIIGATILAEDYILVIPKMIGKSSQDLIWTLPTIDVSDKVTLVEWDERSIFQLTHKLFFNSPTNFAHNYYVVFGSRFWGNSYINIAVAIYKSTKENLINYIEFFPNNSSIIIEKISNIFSDNSIIDAALSIFSISLRMSAEYFEISPNIIELSPKLQTFSRSQLMQMGEIDLWKEAYPTYILYLDGKTGGYGWIPKRAILDRRILVTLSRYLGPNYSILDFGGGNGTLNYLEHVPYQIDILDINYSYNCLLHKKYDAVICSLVLPWISKLEELFIEFFKILKNKGYIFITLPNPFTYHTGKWSSLSKGEFTVISRPPKHGSLSMIGRVVGPLKLYARTTGEVVTLLGKNGFRIIELDDSNATVEEEKLMLSLGFPHVGFYRNVAPFVTIIAQRL